MLASVVPGLREIRAPLAAGYLWLIAAWLLVANYVAPESRATGLLARAYDLKHAVGAIGLGVAISFVAYLIGSVTEPLAKTAYGRLNHLRRRRRPPYLSRSVPGHVLDVAMERVVLAVDDVRRHGGDPMSVPHPDVAMARREVTRLLPEEDPEDLHSTFMIELSEIIGREIVEEMDLAQTRLIGAEPELYSEVDRLKAESDLRFAILPPLLVLTAILVAEGSLYWLFVLPFAAVLARQALRSADRADRRLVDAIRLRRTAPPSLERFEAAMKLAAERAQEDARRRGAE